MRIPSGVTDQFVYFVAVDATDLKTRETGFSSFTVYRSRDGAAAAAMTTPTINETDSSNMPGVYELLLDEDTTIAAGNDSEEMALHITHAGMAPITRVVELYRPKITAGYTLGVESDGDLTQVNALAGHTAQTADHTAAIATAQADLDTLTGTDGATLATAQGNYAPSIAGDAMTLTAAATSAQLVDDIWDEQLTVGSHNTANSAGRRLRNIQDFGIYDLARVWVDEVAGSSSGTTDGEDATVTNRADDLDNALTVAASVGLDEVNIQAGNSITLTAGLAGYKVHAYDATIAFGGQSLAGTRVYGASVSGIFTGNPVLVDCVIDGTITGPGATLINCRLLAGVIENNGTDHWLVHDGRGETAGNAASLTFDFNSTANADCSLRNYSGGLTINGMVASNEMSVEGQGSITEGTCTAGSPQIRGIFKLNSITNLTPDTEAAINLTNINTEIDTALSDINLDHLAKTATAGADMTTEVVDNSIISRMLANGDTSAFDPSTDGLQPIRDRGDAAWATGGGGAISDILNVSFLMPTSIDLANTATVRLGLMLTNAVDDLPSTAEITPGTISIDRKAIGGTSWSSVVSDAACSEAAGHIYYDEVFDSGTGYAEGDSLRITLKSQKITVAANDYEITDATGVMWQTEIRQTMRGTDSAATAAELAKVPKSDGTSSWNATALAAINAEADTALTDYGANTTTPPTATAIVDEWETQSQADPTGFHVNVKEIGDTAQTANDNGLDINTLITQVGTAGDGLTAINLPNQTMDIVGDITGNLSGSIGSVTGNVGGNVVGSVASVTAGVNATSISGSTDAADKLEASAETIVIGTVSHDNTVSSTMVFYSDDITEATADHFNGRIVIFTSGALTQQATDITDYELVSGEGKFTVTALTEAPADNVTFVIV